MNNFIDKTGISKPVKVKDIPVLVIFAPTACGKTSLMETLFEKTTPLGSRVEIISADSMQVYKSMNIGTAKPDAEFLSRVPHKMLDVCSPKEQFGAGEFVRRADEMCNEIWKKNKLPVICGGTAFYIRNFIYGLPPTPEVDTLLRKKIANRMQKEGALKLWTELQLKDPESASKININDEYRIKRALEIIIGTGHPRSYFSIPQTERKGYNFCVIELQRPRKELYKRINERVEILFKQGLQKEVETLLKAGYTKDDPGMQAIGYREFFMYDNFSQNDNLEHIKECIKKDTRRYAKRQITFFKPLPNVMRIAADDIKGVKKTILDNFTFIKDATLDEV